MPQKPLLQLHPMLVEVLGEAFAEMQVRQELELLQVEHSR